MTTDRPSEWMLGNLLEEAGVVACAPGGGFNPTIRHLTVDSREVKPGTCFVALPGTRHDGHDFLRDAIRRGAAAVLVQADRAPPGIPQAVRVPNTHVAVARLAAAFFGVTSAQRAGRLTLAGVTGTNGKTTVCTLLRSILEAGGVRAAGFGTIINHDGAQALPAAMTTMPPIALCRALADAHAQGVTHAVLEVSSHALDQRRCAGLTFDVGVFTNLSRDHLDYHPDMVAYARAKRRLFDDLSPAASAIVCADDASADGMVAHCAATVVRYGLDADARAIQARRIAVDDDRVRFVTRLDDQELEISTALVGHHNIRNILAAAAAAHALGIAPDAIARGIAAVTTVPGRLQPVGGDAPFRVFVDYAHTPDALANVLGIVGQLTAGRVICVFGCGGDRDRGKRPAMARAVAGGAAVAIVTSDNPRGEDPQAIIQESLAGFAKGDACAMMVEADRATAIEQAIALAQPGDSVLIAGKGHERFQVIGERRIPFDDVAEARRALDLRLGAAPRKVAS